MSRDYIPVLAKESVTDVLEDLQAEAEMRRAVIGDSAAAQISHALATQRIEVLEDVCRRLGEIRVWKVLKHALKDDDENYRLIDEVQP